MTTEARQQFENRAAHFCLKHNVRTINCTPRTAELIQMLQSAYREGLQQAAELIEDVARISEESADYGSDFRPIMGLRRMAAAIREKIAEQENAK